MTPQNRSPVIIIALELEPNLPRMSKHAPILVKPDDKQTPSVPRLFTTGRKLTPSQFNSGK